jgi:hypothetical protein
MTTKPVTHTLRRWLRTSAEIALGFAAGAAALLLIQAGHALAERF